MLRTGQITHHKQGETETPFNYKIEDEVYYSIEFFRWDRKSSEWVPYIAPHSIMLEWVMLDPYIRMPLKQIPGSPLHVAEFKVNLHLKFYISLSYVGT